MIKLFDTEKMVNNITKDNPGLAMRMALSHNILSSLTSGTGIYYIKQSEDSCKISINTREMVKIFLAKDIVMYNEHVQMILKEYSDELSEHDFIKSGIYNKDTMEFTVYIGYMQCASSISYKRQLIECIETIYRDISNILLLSL